MKLQGLCISKKMPKELYFRGEACVNDDGISVPAGKLAAFNTYFNLFSVCFWRKYTEVKTLSVEMTVQGEGTAIVVGFDQDPRRRTRLSEISFSSSSPVTLTLLNSSIDRFPDHLYVSVKARKNGKAVKAGAHILDIVYSADDTAAHFVRVACSFCTFKREKEILENVRNIAGLDKVEVFISDNGHTLTEEMFAGLPCVHLFQNRNYGGSSGFTRCMIESVIRNEAEPFTHVLLMDDDALIEPYVMERTISLLSVLKPEHRGKLIGGAMLSLEQPTIQMESGAWIDPKTWRIELPGRNYNLGNLKKVLENEDIGRVDYNGWFYCCIPVSFIRKDNLPLPMFIHADDQEYGIRNMPGVIRMNGICIWHPSPWSKKRSYIEYYDARNGMIAMSSTSPEMSWLYACVRAWIMALRFMLVYRYDDAEYMLRGYYDYYKGPDWFKDQDPEKLNSELMQWKKQESYKASQEEIDRLINNPETELESKKVRKLFNMLIPAFNQKAVFDINLPRDCIFALAAKQFCVVEPETGEGYKLIKSYRKFFSLSGQLLTLGAFMAQNHRKIHSKWVKEIKDMGTYQFWKDYLGLV